MEEGANAENVCMSEYVTKTVGKDFAEVQDFIIVEEAMARLIFRAQIHPGGVRGRLIRQRRVSKDDAWSTDTAIDIRTLEKGGNFNVELNTSAIAKLYKVIEELKVHVETNGVDYGTHRYKTVQANKVVIDSNNISEIVQKIIDGEFSEEVLKAFSESRQVDLTTFADAERVRSQRVAILALEARLEHAGGYPEVKGNDSWQKFILNNHWMFGANYLDPIDRAKVNIKGSMPDFLYPTADGFADVLEIKLPTEEVIVEDKNHAGSWRWTPETNAAIGQVTNYLIDIEHFRLEIEKEIKSNTGRDVLLLKPRAYILSGNSSSWTPGKNEALRKLNSVLHGIEIITYKDLHNRAKRIVQT